jgi:chorismate-pyruvate lyase
MSGTRTLQYQRHKSRETASTNGILYPLDALYARAGIIGPVVKRTTAERLPSPYKGLLVHQNEMTSTLERHFGGRVTVRTLATFTRGRSYFRRVLLALEKTGRPVSMGAVRLRLDAFSPAVRARILGEKAPLGRILREAGVLYASCPTAFLELTPNAEMLGVFWMSEPQTLYGRRTELTVAGDKIGDIVEILPLV